jgi:hypothetical protein
LILRALAAGVVLGIVISSVIVSATVIVMALEDADVVAVEAASTLASDDETTFPACTAESGVTLGRAVGVV